MVCFNFMQVVGCVKFIMCNLWISPIKSEYSRKLSTGVHMPASFWEPKHQIGIDCDSREEAKPQKKWRFKWSGIQSQSRYSKNNGLCVPAGVNMLYPWNLYQTCIILHKLHLSYCIEMYNIKEQHMATICNQLPSWYQTQKKTWCLESLSRCQDLRK